MRGQAARDRSASLSGVVSVCKSVDYSGRDRCMCFRPHSWRASIGTKWNIRGGDEDEVGGR